MFSRGSRAQGRHARERRPGGGPSHPVAGRSARPEIGDAGPGIGDAGPAASGEPEHADGPYDSAAAPAGAARLDLGSLKIPSIAGVEVRVQANQEGAVQQVVLVHGGSTLQLAAFAAPRTEPIWDEVRAEIRASLVGDGATVQEVAGQWGPELRARVRTPQGFRDVRFVGVSGPRWLVRAVYQGPAAVDPAQAGPLVACLRGLVVERGQEARPAKEPLPLRLTEEMAAQLAARRATASGAAGSADTAAGGDAEPSGNGSAPRRPSPRRRQE